MPNVTDFMSNVFDLLTNTFSASLPPGTFLQIAWPGISLGPADFKPLDSPGGNYDPNRAEETFSLVSNIAPACSVLRFDNSGFEIDDLYQILIAGAIPQGADPANLAVNPAPRTNFSATPNMSLSVRKKGLRTTPTCFITRAGPPRLTGTPRRRNPGPPCR